MIVIVVWIKKLYRQLLDMSKATCAIIPKYALTTLEKLVEKIPETSSLFVSLGNKMDKNNDKVLTNIAQLLQLAVSRDCFREQSLLNPVVISTIVSIVATLSMSKKYSDSVRVILVNVNAKSETYNCSRVYMNILLLYIDYL